MFIHRGVIGSVAIDPVTGRPVGQTTLRNGRLAFPADPPEAAGAAFRAAVDADLDQRPPISQMPPNDLADRYYDEIPEGIFELANGRVLVGGHAQGSRTLLTWLLELFGPGAAIEQAPLDDWWRALRRAYDAPPVVTDWRAWAAGVPAPPLAEPAGPNWAGPVMLTRHRLLDGLSLATGIGSRRWQVGRFLWHFNVRLGDVGVMPDYLVLGPSRIDRLRGYHVEGAPDLLIEVVMLGQEARDLETKRRLYEAAGVPEYWAIDPFRREVSLWRSVNGRYIAQAPDAQGEYRPACLPGLVFAPERLWQAEDYHREPPVMWCDPGDWPAPIDNDDPDEILPDEPWPLTLALEPTPITYERFLRWQPEHKFEWLGGWPSIGSPRGTEELFNLLLLSEGLVEAVRLLPAARWVAALEAAERLGPLAGRLPPAALALALRPWLGEAADHLAAETPTPYEDQWFKHRSDDERQAARAEYAEHRLRTAVAALRWLLTVDDPPTATAWFTAPHADLDGATPLDHLLRSECEAVLTAARARAWQQPRG